jgi:hypothetical protein
MKTGELLRTAEAELSAKLTQMKIKELDRHLEKILLKLGVLDHKAVVAAVIKALPDIGSEDRFLRVQRTVEQCIQQVSPEGFVDRDLLAKIAIIVVVSIRRQFEKIHRNRR